MRPNQTEAKVPSEAMRAKAREWWTNPEYPDECPTEHEVDTLAALLDEVRAETKVATIDALVGLDDLVGEFASLEIMSKIGRDASPAAQPDRGARGRGGREVRRQNREKFDAVGYTTVDGIEQVVFECRCCGAQTIPGITKEEWLSDQDAEDPAPKVEIL